MPEMEKFTCKEKSLAALRDVTAKWYQMKGNEPRAALWEEKHGVSHILYQEIPLTGEQWGSRTAMWRPKNVVLSGRGGFCSLVKIGLNVSPVSTTLHSRNEVYSLDLIGITLHFTTKVPTI